MEPNVITVTRQFGSLGRPIAKAVAQKLGYDYYDRDIIDKIAEESGYSISELSQYDDSKSTTIYDKMIYPLGLGLVANQKKIFIIEKNIILELAQKSNCVIVGRCADFILRKSYHKNLLNIFMTASYNERYDFCQHTLGLSPKYIENYIAKIDAARADFYNRFTGSPYYSMNYRDIILDSAALPFDQMVDAICMFADLKFKNS